MPVELGLEFLLTARINWLENELKVKTKPVIVKELKFDGVPENVLQLMKEKKLTLTSNKAKLGKKNEGKKFINIWNPEL